MLKYALMATLIVLAGCSKDKTDPVGTPMEADTVYLGSLYDSVLASIFAHNPNMHYTGTQYRYTLSSPNTFMVDENVGMGWATGEEGTYTTDSSTYTFTPTIDRKDSQNPPGTMIATDSLRPVYTGVISHDTLTIENFLNIDDKAKQRNLGTLTLKKQ